MRDAAQDALLRERTLLAVEHGQAVLRQPRLFPGHRPGLTRSPCWRNVFCTMSDIFDPRQALEQAGGNAELARDLFAMLLADLPALRDQAKAALDSGDRQALWDHVHKIHGSTAYCGVPELREAAHAMEQAIKGGDGIDLAEPFAALERAIDRLLAEGPHLLEEADWS